MDRFESKHNQNKERVEDMKMAKTGMLDFILRHLRKKSK